MNSIYLYLTSLILNWTNPIFTTIIMVFLSWNIFLDNMDLLLKGKN